MATLLHRIGRWCATHAKSVVAFWLVMLVGLGVLAGTVSQPTTQVVKFPGADFQKVTAQLDERMPSVDVNTGTAVFATHDGQRFSKSQKAAIKDVLGEWEGAAHVTSTLDPFRTQARLDRNRTKVSDGWTELRAAQTELNDARDQFAGLEAMQADGVRALAKAEREDPTSAEVALRRAGVASGQDLVDQSRAKLDRGQAKIDKARAKLTRADRMLAASSGVRFVNAGDNTAMTQIGFDLDPQSIAPAEREHIVELAKPLAGQGVDVTFGAEITQETSVVGPGEIIGLATAGLVLLIMLGTIIAAGLPLITSLFGVGVGIAGAFAATHYFTMHAMTPALALMLGLAVGIDYTLFILNRHRNQMLRGMEVTRSIALATGTAGNAVVFAGATVVVALAALVVTGVPILAQMGLVAAATVVVAVVMAVTLGPALLGLVGERVLTKRARVRAHTRPVPDDEVVGSWYVRLMTAKPWLTVLAVIAIVAILAVPAKDLRLGLPDGSSEDLGSSAQETYSKVAREFGPGMNGPLVAVVDLPGGADAPRATQMQERMVLTLHGQQGVADVIPIGVSDDRRTLAFQLILDSGPTEAATAAAVESLVDNERAIEAAYDIQIGFTGRTVANLEISQNLSAALPAYLAIVVGLSLVILLLVFRSVLVPLIATGGFLLSVAAAFGSLVAVYQWGWLGSVFGVHDPGPLMSFGPTLIIGVLFGLAMDYQMFLVSGMREAYAHGEDARRAVKTGFTHGAKVVTAAAAIMFAVFGGFVWSHMVMIRPIGFGLAVGVLVDAVLIRMTLTPALMHLLGDRAWWLPTWLNRLLPDLDVEGTTLAARLAQEEQTRTVRPRELV